MMLLLPLVVIGVVVGVMWFSSYNELKRFESLLDDAYTELREQLVVQSDWMREWVRVTGAPTEEWVGWLNTLEEDDDISRQIKRSERLTGLIRLSDTELESYPELDWDAFNHAQARIRDAKQSYNATVERYERRVNTFPGNWVYQIHGFATYHPIH